MQVRDATIADVEGVFSLITYYGELDRMLFRTKADIYERLQTFKVAEDDGRIIGCCSLQIIWSDLAEIKSLAIDKDCTGKGIGRALVDAAVNQAKEIGLTRVFALTLEPQFFEKLGFDVIQKEQLPMKVWSDCARCPKQDRCDETAVIRNLT
ncbi:MAG: N-acetyltransferase [Planctomycetota bacterium]